MTTNERKRMLAAIFHFVEASADGIDHLELDDEKRAYAAAALPRPVVLSVPPQASTERKTGLEPATPILARSCSTN
jgi:hypothetical protein